ncbi:outer membrane beta-barrel protein [Echinicola vietnamensis]|uniref:Outer membrane receptor protein n=1 Tax=Echinicola vietnamensis (strain DSM 17526 / LMG 23754 / KMM 6221) TaxID=926556 RepID=L0FVD4_ECHVK|nr:outer membrane beta-barrel protein [Echinicola vietnamensis]AGA77859.1 outer membrane receptor protein [Echinicola vietnamensis DSM 17526]
MKISYQLCTVLFFFLLASGHAVARQHTELKGSVEDVDGVALPFANVSVLEKEGGRMVVGAVSDENGDFLISTSKTGEVILSISSIGYKTYQTSPFTLESGMKKDFGTIQVEEEATSLDAVEVRSSRPEVIIEADRTVVNVEGTVMAEGSTALDVVGRSPGVYVDADGNINLNGRSGVIVLIDDRQTYMSAKDLANFLRAMPADNIKSIEVINNPPAKYDAEGAAGVLNIQLKKNDYNGMNGSIQAGHYYNGRHAPFAGGSLNLKRGKWTTNLSLNYNTWVRDIDLQILRRFKEENGTSEFDQDALLQLGEENFFLSGGADYQINTKHSVGFSFQASDRDGEENGDSRTDISNPDNPDINHLQALNDSESGNTRVFTNFHYVGNLDTLGTKLSADVDYTVVDGGSLSLLTNNYWVNEATEAGTMDRIRTDNDMAYTIFTAKADFTKPLSEKVKLETGVKGSWVESDNMLDISKSTEDGPFEPDQNSNHFIYNENVLAAYASVKSPLGKKLDFQAGLRMEYSDITGNSVTLNQVNKQEYLNLFPSMFLQHKVSDNYSIIYNVNRRITRPNYRLLNPFVFYVDPLTTEKGNPNLQPQYANNFEMSHVFKQAYQFTLAYSRTTNSIDQVMIQNDETKETTLQVQNFDKSEDFSLRMMVPVEIAEWYSTSNMLHLYYKAYQSQLGDDFLDVSQFSYMARTQHNITLPKGFKVELVGMYISPFLEGQMKFNGFGWVDAGVTKSFKDDKFSVTVNGQDIFRTRGIKGGVNFADINTDIRQYNSQQAVRVTFRWNFSKGEKFKVSNRSGSAEERNRLD